MMPSAGVRSHPQRAFARLELMSRPALPSLGSPLYSLGFAPRIANPGPNHIRSCPPRV